MEVAPTSCKQVLVSHKRSRWNHLTAYVTLVLFSCVAIVWMSFTSHNISFEGAAPFNSLLFLSLSQFSHCAVTFPFFFICILTKSFVFKNDIFGYLLSHND